MAAALGSTARAQSSVTLAWGASADSSVVGYRVYWGGASAHYTNVVDVGEVTSNAVANLQPGATYYFAVTAYDNTDLESLFSNELVYTVPGGGVLPPLSPIRFAADAAALTAPFMASNGIIWQAVETSVTAGGQASYTFTITNAGSYVISAQVNAPNQSYNSFFVNIDAQPTDPTMIWDVQPPTTGFMNRTIGWRGTGSDTAPQFTPEVFNLSAGTHQLIVRGREPNTQLGTLTLSPYFVITNVARLSTGNRTIHGTGVANANCVLLASSSLTPPVTWTPIWTNVSDALGQFSCTDLKATNFIRRFYRIQGR